MKKKTPYSLAVSMLVLAILACSLPGSNQPTQAPGEPMTSVAQTVQVELTAASSQAQVVIATNPPVLITAVPGVTLPPNPTAPPEPTIPAPTSITTPCNRAQFISDVSIPDGTNIQVNQPFTKTWRLKNTGSCTWTSGYQLIFDHGDQMSGPAAQPLTGGAISPGQGVDISVNLASPAAAGTYKGYWQIRDQNGVVFGTNTGAFWVQIITIPPTPTSAPAGATIVIPIPHLTLVIPLPTIILPPPVGMMPAPLVPSESGSVRADGNTILAPNVGDTDPNLSQQAFVSFDISGIPAGATVLEVKTNFGDFDQLGNAFALGCLRMYHQNYGAVDPSDFTAGAPVGSVARWCSAGELSAITAMPELKAAIQAAVGHPRAHFRVQFNDTATNSNNSADMVRLGSGIKLLISFTP